MASPISLSEENHASESGAAFWSHVHVVVVVMEVPLSPAGQMDGWGGLVLSLE